MKNKKNIVIVLLVILVLIALVCITKKVRENERIEDEGKIKIVTSFYPIYMMTKNITEGVEDVEVVNMAETTTGCVHNYTLTTDDLKKFENADIFVINGLELEGFINKITKSYEDLKVINTTEKFEEKLKEEHKNEHEINPHVWIAFENYKEQVKEIANKLSQYDENNKDKYNENLEKYLEKLEEVENRYKNELSNLEGQTVLSLNESFEYLGGNSNFNIISIETDHEESTLSAEKLAKIIEEIKDKNIKAVIIDKSDNQKNAQTIIKETGIKLVVLDSAMEGTELLDSYINTMKYNLELLKEI